MFRRTSRYYALPTLTYRRGDGETYRYTGRRLIPRQVGPTADAVRIEQAERLDLVAQRVLGDPLRFWRLCDVNGVLDPFAVNAATGSLLVVPED